MEEVIGEALQRCEPWRASRAFDVAVEFEDEARNFTAGGEALTSAIHNLLENAIKYGDPEQTIHVRVRLAEGLRIEIHDEGPGVPAAEHARLFEPFFRGKQAQASAIQGSGLGLGVARDIAEAHGGSLKLMGNKPEERGATFVLALPDAPQP